MKAQVKKNGFRLTLLICLVFFGLINGGIAKAADCTCTVDFKAQYPGRTIAYGQVNQEDACSFNKNFPFTIAPEVTAYSVADFATEHNPVKDLPSSCNKYKNLFIQKRDEKKVDWQGKPFSNDLWATIIFSKSQEAQGCSLGVTTRLEVGGSKINDIYQYGAGDYKEKIGEEYEYGYQLKLSCLSATENAEAGSEDEDGADEQEIKKADQNKSAGQKSGFDQTAEAAAIAAAKAKTEGEVKGTFDQLQITDPKLLIARFIVGVLGVIGSLSLVMFIYGGILWMTARGDSAQSEKAGSIVVWTSLGLAVIFASYALVDFVIEAFR